MTPSLSINFGTQENGTPFIYDLRDARNILVAGGGGVTRLLTYILLDLLDSNTTEQLEIIMIGCIANYNLPWRGFPHITKITDETKFFSCLTNNADEIQHRSELLLNAKCSDIEEYNKSAEHALPYRIITIGDLQTLLSLDKELTLRCLDLICKHGPHVGIFLIAKQAYDIPQEIMDVFHTKLVFTQVSEQDFTEITNETKIDTLLKRSQFNTVHGKVLFYTNNTMISKFSIHYLPAEKEKTITNKIINRYITHQSLTIKFGTKSDDTDFIYDICNTNGLLISGHTGSSESMFISEIVANMAQNFSSNECQIVLIDTRGVDQHVWNGIPHLTKPVISLDIEAAIDELKLQIQEILHRYDALIESECFNIDHYNYIAKDKMPLRTIIIDEYCELFYLHNQTPHLSNIIINDIQTIVKLGPTVGVYLIMATQRPDMITEGLHQIFNTKISFQARDKRDSIRMLGLPGSENLKPSREILFRHKNTTPTKITIPYLSDEEIRNIVTKLRK